MPASALVVGLGRIGLEYDLELSVDAHVYTHSRALSLHPAFRMVAGVDAAERQRHRFSDAYGLPAYEDLTKALERHAPELVVIAVPTPLHGRTLECVLERSAPRAVLCEKPLSYDVPEARRMVEACASRSVPLFVNYMRRSDPGAIEVRRRIVAGQLATPVKGIAWYSKGLFHNGSHLVNLLEYWLGPLQDCAMLGRGRLWEERDPEPDFRAGFERGSIVMLAAWEEAFSHHAIELLSSSGRLRYDRGGEAIVWQPVRPDPHFPGYRGVADSGEPIPSGMMRYQWHVTEQLARALDGHEAHLCPGRDALQTLLTMTRILES